MMMKLIAILCVGLATVGLADSVIVHPDGRVERVPGRLVPESAGVVEPGASGAPTELNPNRVVVRELYFEDLQTGSLFGKAVTNGTEITWQATASPWERQFSISNQLASAQAKADFLNDLKTARSNLVEITSSILTNITDTQSLVATNFTGAQRTQIASMQREQTDTNQQLRRVAAELRKLINALSKLERQQ